MHNIDQQIKQASMDHVKSSLDTVTINGKFHRFQDPGDKGNKKSAYYILHKRGDVVVGSIGSFRTGLSVKFCSNSHKSMTPDERAEYDATVRKLIKKSDKKLAILHAKCRKEAKKQWKDATTDGRLKHPYVLSKGIKPYNVKINEAGSLIVPIFNADKVLQGLQTIGKSGFKMFMRGTAFHGNFLIIGAKAEDTSVVLICEGWATGCSIHQATGLKVVVAFNAGNLKPVAEVLREKFPEQKFVITGDDDHETESGNTGKKKAIEAAKAINAIPVFPEFEDPKGKTDFNDLHLEQGLDAVKSIIMDACAKDPADYDEDTWPVPILFGAIETPTIQARLLPKKLARFCRAVAKNTQTPSGMSIMMVLAAISTCLQKRFIVSPYAGDTYREPVNLMALIGSESGTRKSAVVELATGPLSKWEADQEEALKEKAEMVKHQREIIQKTIAAIKSSLSKPETTPEELKEGMKQIKRLEGEMPAEIIIPQLWTDNITVEALECLMAANKERMSVISDEGGFFEIISGYYTGGKININVVLKGHAGSAYKIKRMGRTIDMKSPALTLGLAVQPVIIRSLAQGNKKIFKGNGMLERFLFCIPKSTVGFRKVNERYPIPERLRTEYSELIFKLLAIKPAKDEKGAEIPIKLSLEPDALLLYKDFAQSVENMQRQYDESPNMKNWLSKLSGAVLRVAGLCHVAEHGKKNTTIDKVTYQRAVELANLLIVHAKVAFDMMGSDPTVADAKVVFQWIIKNRAESFRQVDVHRALRSRFEKVDRLKAALKILTERHITSAANERYTGHRPEIIYKVSPLALRDEYCQLE